MQKTPLLYAFVLSAFAASPQSFEHLVKTDPADWFSYSGSFQAQRHSALTQIHTGNVENLAAAWIYHVPRAEELEGVPIVANGVMYVPQSNEVYALDARSGRLVWQYQRPVAGRGRNRGLAIYEGRVYLGTTDAFLVALEARTGGVIWETKMPGSVKYQGGAPLVLNNKVVIGAY